MGRRKRRKRRGGTWRPTPRKPKRSEIVASIGLCAVFGLLVLWRLYPTTTSEQTEDATTSWLPRCPVGGMPINFAHTLTTDDGPVFFCCHHCVEKYQAEPSRYAAEVSEERRRLRELPSVQVTCPVSGQSVDPAVFAQDGGRQVLFCSDECRRKFVADPAAYRRRIVGTLWYQTRCPVTGNPIDPRAFSVLGTGEKVYFCSEACKETFLHDPSAWANKLTEQGLRLHF